MMLHHRALIFLQGRFAMLSQVVVFDNDSLVFDAMAPTMAWVATIATVAFS